MAKITVTVEGSTIGSATIATEYNQADSDRFTAWLTAHYGTHTDEAGEEQQRDLAGMVSAYWSAVKAGTESNIERWEQEEAKRVAAEGVAPMTGTVTTA